MLAAKSVDEKKVVRCWRTEDESQAACRDWDLKVLRTQELKPPGLIALL